MYNARKVIVVLGIALWVILTVSPSAWATAAHYTDGTTHDGKADWGPPPVAPVWASDCHVLKVDPPHYVWVTEHFRFDDGTPDASIVAPYDRSTPGLMDFDVSTIVANHRGETWTTWNIGTGRSRPSTFDCVPAQPTTTTTEATTSTTSTTVARQATTTTVVKIGTPETVERPHVVPVPHGSSPVRPQAQTAGRTGTLPHTGTNVTIAAIGGLILCVGLTLIGFARGRHLR